MRVKFFTEKNKAKKLIKKFKKNKKHFTDWFIY